MIQEEGIWTDSGGSSFLRLWLPCRKLGAVVDFEFVNNGPYSFPENETEFTPGFYWERDLSQGFPFAGPCPLSAQGPDGLEKI